MKFEIQLLNKQNLVIANLNVESEVIVGAAIIVHDSRYFVYQESNDGRFFEGIRFAEVNPPVEVEGQL
jgi:hypothetical protein